MLKLNATVNLPLSAFPEEMRSDVYAQLIPVICDPNYGEQQ